MLLKYEIGALKPWVVFDLSGELDRFKTKQEAYNYLYEMTGFERWNKDVSKKRVSEL